MSPGGVLAWIPVVREIVGLGQLIADKIRARRARKRKQRAALKRMGLTK